MRILVMTCLLLALTACSHENDTVRDDAGPAEPAAAAASPSATATHGGTIAGGPPPFRIQYDGQELELYPYTYCYGNGCVDGIDPDPVEIGSPAEVRIFVPTVFADVDVHLQEQVADTDEARCQARTFEVPVEDLGGGWHALRPFGPAGTYEVHLSARGGGDMFAGFRWTTPTAGTDPEPSASLAMIAEIDGRPTSYALGLSIVDLQAAPTDASATIEVHAANGRSLTFDATRKTKTPEGCLVGEAGAVLFDGPLSKAKEAARLGGFPFTMTVTLTMDGSTHTATATYPDDEIKDWEPHVPLQFEPALPAWD